MDKPTDPKGCWGVKNGGGGECKKPPRPGMLTCVWHAKQELAAREVAPPYGRLVAYSVCDTCEREVAGDGYCDCSDWLECGECGEHAQLEEFDTLGACPGQVFCPACNTEMDATTGVIHTECDYCKGKEDGEDEATGKEAG